MVVADINNEDYVLRSFFEEESVRLKILDKMTEDNFENPNNKKIVNLVNRFRRRHNRIPSAQEIVTGLNENPGYCDEAKEQLIKILQPMGYVDKAYQKNLIENYFQFTVSQRLLEEYALMMHNKDSESLRGIVPKLKDALNFKLNIDMGLHYIRDTGTAMGRLKNNATFIPSKLAMIRLYTSQSPEARGSCGGYVRRGLSVVGATSGGGKSMFMVNEAAFAATMGYNVVYISLELDEEKIWERVATCLLDIDRYEILSHTEDEMKVKMSNTKDENAEAAGNLFIKWMPTRVTHMGDIEGYINELENAENIKIDMLVIDYLGILGAIPGSVPKNARTDEKIKYIAEQVRNFCVIRNMAGFTGTQFNRSGYRNKDIGLDNVAESMGLGDTADLFYAIIHDPQMKAYGAVMNTIIKNRNGPGDVMFFTAVNWAHMRITDVTEEQFQELSRLNVEQQLNIDEQPQITPPGPQVSAQVSDKPKKPRGRSSDKEIEPTINGMSDIF